VRRANEWAQYELELLQRARLLLTGTTPDGQEATPQLQSRDYRRGSSIVTSGNGGNQRSGFSLKDKGTQCTAC
jgi:hypothetical protein